MNLIFDFDGTICDNFDYILKLANKYLDKYGREKVTKNDVRTKGLSTLIKESKLPTFLIIYFTLIARKDLSKNILIFKPHNNLPEILQKLGDDHSLGIITSNSRSNVLKFLENNNLESNFDYIESVLSYYGKDKRLNKVIRKYKLNPKYTFYIGDEERDIVAAKKVGIKSVAVTWGFESESILKKVKPDFIVSNPKEILKIFQASDFDNKISDLK